MEIKSDSITADMRMTVGSPNTTTTDICLLTNYQVRRGVFTCVRWQVTLCDPIWQVTLCSCEMTCSGELYHLTNQQLSNKNYSYKQIMVQITGINQPELSQMEHAEQNAQSYKTIHLKLHYITY